MPYTPFHLKFPEIAKKETRALNFINGSGKLKGAYILDEAYCDEKDCDCRRVFFNIFSDRARKVVATIAWGWESEGYYAKWLGDDDPLLIKELKGPILNMTSYQSNIAPILLDHVSDLLEDEKYVKRIKDHYRLFREAVEGDHKKSERYKRPLKNGKKIGRNDPCPCGSGKKYKKCCFKY